MAKKKSKPSRQNHKNNHYRSYPAASGANSEPVRSRLDALRSQEGSDEGGAKSQDDQNRLAEPDSVIEDFRPQDPSPPLPPHPDSIASLPSAIQDQFKSVFNLQNAATVTDVPDDVKAEDMMNANGTHTPNRPQQPQFQRDRRHHANDIAPSVNTISNTSSRSLIQVAKPFVFQQAIEGCLNDLAVTPDREDTLRFGGVNVIDDVRKALKLPVRTFDTAVIYFHKFRLSHADNEYDIVNAAAAALFAACKIEDTLKKSRDILCAFHNSRLKSRDDHITPDNPILEQQSRTVIGLERLMLEASSFDFRNRHPQQLLVKLARYYGYDSHSTITKTAHKISLDLYRTYAPLKQSTATMAVSCLELAGRLHGQEQEAILSGRDYLRWGIDRAMVMETLLDLLDIYTQNNGKAKALNLPIDTYLEVRIPLNEEMNTRRLPRYTEYVDMNQLGRKADPAGYAAAATNGVLPSPNGLPPNGRLKASPMSPATPSTPNTPGIRQRANERTEKGSVRFMLNPDREREEKAITLQYAPLLASMRR